MPRPGVNGGNVSASLDGKACVHVVLASGRVDLPGVGVDSDGEVRFSLPSIGTHAIDVWQPPTSPAPTSPGQTRRDVS